MRFAAYRHGTTVHEDMYTVGGNHCASVTLVRKSTLHEIYCRNPKHCRSLYYGNCSYKLEKKGFPILKMLDVKHHAFSS